MLTFSNTPPDDPRGVSLPLKRCPTGRPLSAIITSHDLLGCATHFYGGRTRPCEGEDCEAHKAGVPWRWHSYLAAYSISAKLHFLFESTAAGTEPFLQYRKANATLRGCGFRAQRANTSPNARVIIETKTIDLEGIYLPQAPDLLKVLSIIWNIPLTNIDVEGTNRDAPALKVHQGNHRPPMTTDERIATAHETFERKPA